MAFNRPQPPSHVKKACEAGLAKFIDSGDGLWRIFLEAYPGQHQVHQVKHEAHQVFSLGLRHIYKGGNSIDGTESGNAQPVGWRFVAADETLAGACHVSESPDGLTATLTGLSRVRELATVFELMDKLKTLPQVQEREKDPNKYDLVALRIPGLVEAFWLKSQSPEKDLVVPFHTRIKDANGSIAMRALPMNDFLGIIRPIAEKRLNFQREEG